MNSIYQKHRRYIYKHLVRFDEKVRKSNHVTVNVCNGGMKYSDNGETLSCSYTISCVINPESGDTALVDLGGHLTIERSRCESFDNNYDWDIYCFFKAIYEAFDDAEKYDWDRHNESGGEVYFVKTDNDNQ